MMRYRAVIFDMDGTVLDTVQDLRSSLNYAFEACQRPGNFTGEEVRRFFGSGIRTAVIRALALQRGEETWWQMEGDDDLPQSERALLERILSTFSAYYPDHCNLETKPYDGICTLLGLLKERGVRTAVVSNKLDAAVQELSEELFAGLFDFAVGESEKRRRKPYPDMTCYALEKIGAAREEAVYIGDSEVDLETAGNAGLDCISVAWGFRDEDFLRAHGARHIVHRPEEILELLEEGSDTERIV